MHCCYHKALHIITNWCKTGVCTLYRRTTEGKYDTIIMILLNCVVVQLTVVYVL